MMLKVLISITQQMTFLSCLLFLIIDMNLKLLFLFLGTALGNEEAKTNVSVEDIEELVPESIRNARAPKILAANGRVRPIEENEEEVLEPTELDDEPTNTEGRGSRQFWPLPHFYPR